MSDLVEQVARALAELDGAKWDARNFGETPCGQEPEDMREGYCDQARAALSVLEPRIEALERELAEAVAAERFCRECGASVAVDPSFMACHCRTMIWPIRNGEATHERTEHERA